MSRIGRAPITVPAGVEVKVDENNHIVARLITEEAQRQGAGVIATSVGYHLKIDGANTISL